MTEKSRKKTFADRVMVSDGDAEEMAGAAVPNRLISLKERWEMSSIGVRRRVWVEKRALAFFYDITN